MAAPSFPLPTLHHVTLKTQRKEEMMAWYGLVVGLEPHYDGPEGAWLTNDSANHRMALLCHPRLEEDADKVAHTGLHHTAYEYPDLDQLLETYTRLKGHGLEPHVALDHGMTISFYYLDPDGNSVELQVDNFGDWTESSRWMATSEEFQKNPIGTEVNPQDLVDARAAGASHEEIHRRSYAGEFPPVIDADHRLPSE